MEKLLKLLVHAAAAPLSAAAVANLPDTQQPDPQLAGDGTHQAITQVWETQKVYYQAVMRSLDDPTWESPRVGNAADWLTKLAPLLGATGPVATLLPLIRQLLGGAAPSPAPVPLPTAGPPVLK